MDIGESLTRGSVWFALSFYVAGELTSARRRVGRIRNADRWLNTMGYASFVGHVACAFHFYHDWSHAAAYADTARQTGELLGARWGGGLYVNYVFLLVWLWEVVWSWVSSKSYLDRVNWINWTVRGFFLFMILNGAVVFARGPMRWFGLILCLLLAGSWWARRKGVAGHASHANWA